MSAMTLVRCADELLRLTSGKKIDQRQVDSLVGCLVDLWVEGDPHNAMELSQRVAQSLSKDDGWSVLSRAIPKFVAQPNYETEMRTNPARHCLEDAIRKIDWGPRHE